MLKQLRVGLKGLDTAQKALGQITNQLIDKLPEDKRKEANALISKAKKGEVDVGELMNFAGSIREVDKEDLKKNVQRVKKKKKEVSKK